MLEQLANPSLSVTIAGKVYPVKPIDGFGQQMIQKMTEATSVEVMYKVAARCLGLPFAEVFGTEDTVGFSNADIMRVVEVAGKQVQEVNATIPNDGKADAARDGQEPSRPQDSPQPMQLAS